MALLFTLLLGFTTAQLPEQVHLSFSDSQHSLTVEWVTFQPTASSEVIICFNLSCSIHSGFAVLWLYYDAETGPGIPRYIHSVSLPSLRPRSLYTYRVGASFDSLWSGNFTLISPINDLNGQFPTFNSTSFLLIGDFGTCSDIPKQTVAALSEEARTWQYDALFHAGDIAYNLETENGRRGDGFMRDIEPIASALPYMVAVGNHEKDQNFTSYKHRFHMPQGHDSMYYSLNLGPVHVLVYSSEVFCGKKCEGVRKSQWEWMLADLEAAKQDRAKRPWLVAISHKPLYCSTSWSTPESIEDCSLEPQLVQQEYESLFAAYHLDVHFHGHVHSYERTQPIYKGNGMGGRYMTPNIVVDAEAPVYVIEGNAGTCRENDLNLPSPTPESWSIFRSFDLGYLRITANSTIFRLSRIVSSSRLLEDQFYLVKSP
jgi:hypothetical protein